MVWQFGNRVNWGITWEEFKALLKSYGFEIISEERFRFQPDYAPSIDERPANLIAAHRDKKLLLHATSYISGDYETINGGYVYGTLGNYTNAKAVFAALDGCSHGDPQKPPVRFDYDIRKDLLGTLSRLQAVAQFVEWHDPDRYVYLLDYAEEQKTHGKNWKQKRDEFLRTAPEWVRKFVL
jgi:hypothetical protein